MTMIALDATARAGVRKVVDASSLQATTGSRSWKHGAGQRTLPLLPRDGVPTNARINAETGRASRDEFRCGWRPVTPVRSASDDSPSPSC